MVYPYKLLSILGVFILAACDFEAYANTENSTDVSDQSSGFTVCSSYDVRNCRTERPGQFTIDDSVRQLEVLPGLGFDNLRNLDMGQIFFYNYSICKLTKDGKFLIPNSMSVVPLQEGHYIQSLG